MGPHPAQNALVIKDVMMGMFVLLEINAVKVSVEEPLFLVGQVNV